MAKSVDAQDLKSCGNLSRAGSSPARGTTIILCGSSSVGRASAFQAECREFDPRLPLHYEPLAQSVEHMTFNHGVTGSIPVWLTTSQHNKPYVPVAQLDRATAF